MSNERAEKRAGSISQTARLPSVITAGEIIGWRGWFVRQGHLRSLVAVNYWRPGKPMVGNVDETLEMWGSHILLGVYAYKELDNVARSHLISDVIGRVKLWGKVIEYEFGYRAEYASILSLDYAVTSDVDLHNLREFYKL